MKAVSGTVTRVEGSIVYVSIGSYEVSAAPVGATAFGTGMRVLVIEYDRPDSFAVVGTLPPTAPPA